MAKLLASIFVLSTLLSFSSGCLVRTRGGGQAQSRARSCGPAHHWDGNSCVHNGRARGHNKHNKHGR